MANTSTGAMASFGEASRLTELRKRFFFLLGGLVVVSQQSALASLIYTVF